jgi:hypothetical protein
VSHNDIEASRSVDFVIFAANVFSNQKFTRRVIKVHIALNLGMYQLDATSCAQQLYLCGKGRVVPKLPLSIRLKTKCMQILRMP